MHIELDGLKIKYNQYGTKQNKPILFVHGLGSSSLIWQDLPEAFAENFYTITIDLPGFGESDKPNTEYTMKFFCSIIKNLLYQLGIRKDNKINMIGHSLGGYIITEFALHNLDIVNSLILIDSSGFLTGPTPLLKEYLEAVIDKDKITRYLKIKQVFKKMLARPYLLVPVFIDIFISNLEKPGFLNAFESAFRNSTEISLDIAKLNQINEIPCLIIWGEKDNLIPISYMDKFIKHIPNAKSCIIKEVGHSPFVEKPVVTYQKMYSFLANVNNNEKKI